MNDFDKQLNEIFNKAKAQAPVASFEETKEMFIETITVAGGTSSNPGGSGVLSSTLKNILMGTLAIVTVVISIIYMPRFQKTNNDTQGLILQDTSQLNAVKQDTLSIFPNNGKSKIEGYDHATTSNSTEILADNSQNHDPADSSISKAMNILHGMNVGHPTDGPNLDSTEAYYAKNKKGDINPLSSLKQQVSIDIPITPILDIVKLEGTPVLFTVTERSTESELYNISTMAKNAGINYRYQVHHQRIKKNRDLFLVRDFNAKMTLPATGAVSNINISVPKMGKFKVTVGWYVNEKGKVIKLSDSVSIGSPNSKYKLD